MEVREAARGKGKMMAEINAQGHRQQQQKMEMLQNILCNKKSYLQPHSTGVSMQVLCSKVKKQTAEG